MSSPTLSQRNRWSFAVGTLGRDMVYTLMAMFLMVFLTEVLDLPDEVLWWVNGLLLAARLLDAVLDLAMGAVVDRTRSRWGHYKPWIAVGAVTSGVLTVLMFSDLGVRGPAYAALFAVIYLLWGVAWTANDIPYWSLLPALTLDQKERESLGSLAKVFATLGLFTVAVGVIPVTTALGGTASAWTIFSVGVVVVMLLGQTITLVGVQEPRLAVEQERTSVRELFGTVARNDQLGWTSVALTLFLTGIITTTSFGFYYFKYVYRDEALYSPFVAVLGVAQLIGFAVFPVLRTRLSRRRLHTLAMVLIVAGYVIFLLSPLSIIGIAVAGALMFVGQSFVVVLMLVFISDCIEYGHWKQGVRSTAVTFALQPFISKVTGALATAVTGVTLTLTGINAARTPTDVTPAGLAGLTTMMLVVPLVLVVASYAVHRATYRIDETFHARMIEDLRARGDLA